MSNLFQQERDDAREAHASRRDWFNAIEGIVAETDPVTMSVKVTIPVLDEHTVFDEWIPVLTPFVGPEGYGACFLPAVGSEVILFSRGNEGLSLYALSRFNEGRDVPAEFRDGSRGLKSEKTLKLLSDQLLQLVGLTFVLIRSNDDIDLDAPDVRLLSGGAVSVHAAGNAVGFLGADPAERQQLPPDAVDLETCKALCNALKHLVAIKFGFAE
jgi:Type VI secretion system/phage-baseplate injector OB domain